mmetsp:Transcript_41147/g.46759  ORF Transcript_41147/g.46759 Transcript_41147/m.46759 type:complete len:347 (-) Transcript_41147:197-1237(-)
MTECNNNDDDMSIEDRINYLRERGVLVETPEERRLGTKKATINDGEAVSFLFLPHDTSKPMKEVVFRCNSNKGKGDNDELMEYLKPMFTAAANGGKDVDLELFRRNRESQQTLASSSVPGEVSLETLHKVAEQGNVEKFVLVHPTESNKYVGVNIYLDEAGMLRRLPLNTRATDYAKRAGYNPAPQFYGNVFLGRIQAKPVLRNIDLKMGKDTSFDASWLQQAPMDNTSHQMKLNQMTGRNETQAAVIGTDGTEKKEKGYTWTQTEEEIEILLPITNTTDIKSKDVTAKFLPKSIQIKLKKEPVLVVTLFERIDPDGCTWTIDRKDNNLILTLEKSEQALWPRIED